MNTLNEMYLAWVVWVNSNYDVLIMTITLLIVAGLMLEVIKLNKKIDVVETKMKSDIQNILNGLDLNYEILKRIRLNNQDQVNVNIHLAKDIAELQKKLKEVKTKRKVVRK